MVDEINSKEYISSEAYILFYEDNNKRKSNDDIHSDNDVKQPNTKILKIISTQEKKRKRNSDDNDEEPNSKKKNNIPYVTKENINEYSKNELLKWLNSKSKYPKQYTPKGLLVKICINLLNKMQ